MDRITITINFDRLFLEISKSSTLKITNDIKYLNKLYISNEQNSLCFKSTLSLQKKIIMYRKC